MPNVVHLSDKTRDLFVKIKPISLDGLHVNDDISVDRNELISVLTVLEVGDHPQRFLLESLRASLLHDLRHALFIQKENQEQEQKKSGLFSKFIFWTLVFGGTILSVCGGYDAVYSLLPFVTLPVWMGQLLTGVFVVLSVAVFYAFDVSQISDNLGVKLPEFRMLLDVFSEQVQDIHLIRKYVKNKMNTGSSEALSECSLLLDMLQHQQKHLNIMQDTYKKRSDSGYLMVAKRVTGIVIGLLFFLGGFFVSQAPAVAFFTALTLSAASMVWPVLITSMAIGLAAFALYWYVERPGVDQFMARLFGLDNDKIAALNKCKVDDFTGRKVTATSKLDDLRQQLDLKLQHAATKDGDITEVQPLLVEPVVLAFLPRVTREQSMQTDPVELTTPMLALQMGS